MPENTDAPIALSPGVALQGETYLQGTLAGTLPPVPADFASLEAAARAVMSDRAFAYIAGGAGLETTAEANRAAFARRAILPRMLRDVSARDLGITLFGRRLASPILAAPIGVQDLAHPEGDLAAARAAASQGVPFIISNQASHPMEAIAAAMGDAPRWFQLYWGKSDALVESFARRAEASGCEAIVVTLDTTMLGWRPRDLNLGYLPFLEGKGIAQYTTDPVFQALVGDGSAPLTFMTTYTNPALTWDKLSLLRRATKLPVLLKGILDPRDAARAVEAGMDGVIVSNHGGRQVDGAIASLDALPRVAEIVAGRIPVLFDSGIRTGADIFKALALGATAVCVGRPYIYGLAIAGETGAARVFRNLIAEFDLTLGLAGCTRIADIDPSRLAPGA